MNTAIRRKPAIVIGAVIAASALAVSGCSSSKSSSASSSSGASSSAVAPSDTGSPTNTGQTVNIVAYSVPKPAYDLLTAAFNKTAVRQGRHLHRVLRREWHAEHRGDQRPEG